MDGNLKTMQPLDLKDLHLCDDLFHAHKNIRFGQKFESKCKISVLRLLKNAQINPVFMDMYINYTENNISLMKAVPILIRNAFSHNMVSMDFLILLFYFEILGIC